MAYIKVNSGIHLRDIGEESILYDTSHRKIHVLNNTASIIWKQCCASNTSEQIAQLISERFQLPFEKALNDVQELVAVFAGLQLLSESGDQT